MKKYLLAIVLFTFITCTVNAQQEDHNTPTIGAVDTKEQKQVMKKVEKSEKRLKKH